MFGFGKKKELKEFEERLDTLIKLWQLWDTAVITPKLLGLTHEQKVIAAIFFDCIVVTMFNDLGKTYEDHALAVILGDNDLEISDSDINIGRYLAQGVGDECAILVAKMASEALQNFFNEKADGFALNSLLTDSNLNFDTEEFAKGILLADGSPSAYTRPSEL